MTNLRHIGHIVACSVLAALVGLSSACVVAVPREGYYDHDHHRYWQDHTWHECADGDAHCR